MNMLFQTKDERKRRIFYSNIHKAMRIPIHIHETNKKVTVTVQQKMHVDWSFQIIYDQHFLTNHSLTVMFLK